MLAIKRKGSGNGSPSVFSIVNYDTYQTEDQSEQNGFGNASGTVAERLRNETKKVKKGKKETPPGLDLTFEGYLERFQLEGQQVLRQAVAAIATTRKSGQVSASVVNGIAQQLARHPETAVLAASRIYIDRDHAGEGRNERYLFGIVRGEAKRGSVNGAGAPHAAMKTPGQLAIERAIRAQQAEWKAEQVR
jgi:hypothetical protein